MRYSNLLDLLKIPDKASGTLAIKPQYRDIVFEAKNRMIRVEHWKLVYQSIKGGALCQTIRPGNQPGLPAQSPSR
ncbi:MAG: hypothetical protein Q8L02_05025 [Candidatus Nitrotoga sp.]|nr:hypothetical protein [Candidatus Nitrotoga sp.]